MFLNGKRVEIYELLRVVRICICGRWKTVCVRTDRTDILQFDNDNEVIDKFYDFNDDNPVFNDGLGSVQVRLDVNIVFRVSAVVRAYRKLTVSSLGRFLSPEFKVQNGRD